MQSISMKSKYKPESKFKFYFDFIFINILNELQRRITTKNQNLNLKEI